MCFSNFAYTERIITIRSKLRTPESECYLEGFVLGFRQLFGRAGGYKRLFCEFLCSKNFFHKRKKRKPQQNVLPSWLCQFEANTWLMWNIRGQQLSVSDLPLFLCWKPFRSGHRPKTETVLDVLRVSAVLERLSCHNKLTESFILDYWLPGSLTWTLSWFCMQS